MFRVCQRKIDNHILEMQSGGKVDRRPKAEFTDNEDYQKYLKNCDDLESSRLNTLFQNALNTGYMADEVRIFWATEEEYAQAQEADPVLRQQKAEQEAKQTKVVEAKAGMEELPGWATWTADQVEEWIEGNVKSLADVKRILKNMAKAITYLRDYSHILQ
ncbi:MAG: hypothetical protein AB1585_03095 [Thermodesulfobacteriota bacterium]